jgi:hypothetical protein
MILIFDFGLIPTVVCFVVHFMAGTGNVT